MSTVCNETAYVAKRQFTATHWSVIAAACDSDGLNSAEALNSLCRAYWFPLYAFVRRRGYPGPEAEDLTQEFFARLLETDFLRPLDRSKGKFRSFLLAALEHFLAKEWRRAHAQKRGGDQSFVSLDARSEDGTVLQVAGANLTPEQFFDQQWAITLLEQAVGRLQREFQEAGKGALFQRLKTYLTGERPEISHAELAVELHMTEAALKMAISRMRRRYGELLRAEITRTVSGPEEVEEEFRALFAALSR